MRVKDLQNKEEIEAANVKARKALLANDHSDTECDENDDDSGIDGKKTIYFDTTDIRNKYNSIQIELNIIVLFPG